MYPIFKGIFVFTPVIWMQSYCAGSNCLNVNIYTAFSGQQPVRKLDPPHTQLPNFVTLECELLRPII